MIPFLLGLIIIGVLTVGPFYFGLLLVRILAEWAKQKRYLLVERTVIVLGVPVVLVLASLAVSFLVRRAQRELETWLSIYTGDTWRIAGFVVGIVVLGVGMWVWQRMIRR
jgi:hypothetical protein